MPSGKWGDTMMQTEWTTIGVQNTKKAMAIGVDEMDFDSISEHMVFGQITDSKQSPNSSAKTMTATLSEKMWTSQSIKSQSNGSGRGRTSRRHKECRLR